LFFVIVIVIISSLSSCVLHILSHHLCHRRLFRCQHHHNSFLVASFQCTKRLQSKIKFNLIIQYAYHPIDVRSCGNTWWLRRRTAWRLYTLVRKLPEVTRSPMVLTLRFAICNDDKNWPELRAIALGYEDWPSL
jgi:hypothetical protein